MKNTINKKIINWKNEFIKIKWRFNYLFGKNDKKMKSIYDKFYKKNKNVSFEKILNLKKINIKKYHFQ